MKVAVDAVSVVALAMAVLAALMLPGNLQ